ncbi:MAG: hypothetical protein MUE53_00665 [Chitinophagales bacterium]|nr:hypothetical protein [Chitinophagales bacterium]
MIHFFQVRFLLVFLFNFSCLVALAQLTSPFASSEFGRRVLYSNPNSFGSAFSQGYRNTNVINDENVASLSAPFLTLIDVGLIYNQLNATYKDSFANSNSIGLSHFKLLFPFNTGKNSLLINFQKVSDIAFASKSVFRDSTYGNVTDEFEADGSIYRANVGFSHKINNLSLGLKIGLEFGSINYTNANVLTVDQKQRYIGSVTNSSNLNFLSGLSAQYVHPLNKRDELIIGASWESLWAGNKSMVNYNTVLFDYRSDNSFLLGTKTPDSFYTERNEGFQKVAFGLSFSQNKSIKYGLDFNYIAPSNHVDPLRNRILTDFWTVNTGIEIIPAMNASLDNRKFFNKITYRLGAAMGTSPYLEETFSFFRISGGLGIPTKALKLNLINLGLSYQITNISSSDYSEGALSFYAGFTIGDKWFYRPKFD